MLGDANWILRGRGRRHYVRDYPGPLSIKTVQRGSAVWKTAEGEFRVDESCFLVLNAGQTYSLTLESPQTIETCCVFFQTAFVDVGGEFPTRLWAPDARILPRMRAVYRSGDDEDQLVLLASDLAALLRDARGERHRVPGLRAATREELYGRLSRAREYLHASYLEPVSLDDLARVASVSPYHFHRAFTRAFGETPQQYRTRLRLDRARQLLRRGDLPVTQVCLESGFESLGSFSTLFRRRYGFSPRHAKTQD